MNFQSPTNTSQNFLTRCQIAFLFSSPLPCLTRPSILSFPISKPHKPYLRIQYHLQYSKSSQNYSSFNVYANSTKPSSVHSASQNHESTSNTALLSTTPIETSHNSLETNWVITGPSHQQLFIIDAFGLLYRSYYALARTTMSSHGLFDTRTVYGFTMVLLSFLQRQAKGNPTVVVFEGRKKKGESDFRTQLYPQYKEGRGPTPTGVIESIPWVKKICEILGLAIVEVDLFEADDTIGTLVNKAKKVGLPSTIVSMDKDFKQLLESDLVQILKPAQGGSFENITEDSFRKDYQGIHPRQYIDVLALMGDKADGLKGVPGIGKITAPKLIAHYGSLENLLAAVRIFLESEDAAKLEGKDNGKRNGKKKSNTDLPPLLTMRLAKSLYENTQHSILMKRLISIRENVPIGVLEWEDIVRKPVDIQEATELFKKLEFSNRTIFKRFIRSADNVPHLHRNKSLEKTEVETVDNFISEGSHKRGETNEQNDSHNKVREKTGKAWVFKDTEYKMEVSDKDVKLFSEKVQDFIGILPVISDEGWTRKLMGLCFCNAPGNVIYLPTSDSTELPISITEVLENPKIQKTGWFLKELHKELVSKLNIRTKGKLFDNRIASEMLHGGEKITDTKVAALYLGEGALDPWTKGQNHRISLGLPIEESMGLCDVGFRLAQKLMTVLEEKNLFTVASTVEFPLIQILGDMELAGVPLDANGLRSLKQTLQSDLQNVEKEMNSLVPKSDQFTKRFRPTSRDDVALLLFEIWKIEPNSRKTSSGRYSVNHKALSQILDEPRISKDQRRFVELILRHRELSKVLSTYTNSLINSVHPDGRVRTTFLQDATASGRLSTSSPNLQSIPIRSEIGRQVRRMVQPQPKYSIVCADYSQIELRIIAAMSGDKSLKNAFTADIDVHTSVARKLFKVDEKENVTDEQRRKAKEVNYGIPYGISAYGLSQQLRISMSEAKTLITEYYREFPKVEALTKKLVQNAIENGYAETMLGRRLSLPLLLHGGPQERKAAGRVAVNMPIQGTQADMIKLAMIRISRRLLEAKAKSRMIMQLHDELVLEVADDEMKAVIEVVKEEMTTAFPLAGVDVKVKVGSGKTWLSAAHD